MLTVSTHDDSLFTDEEVLCEGLVVDAIMVSEKRHKALCEGMALDTIRVSEKRQADELRIQWNYARRKVLGPGLHVVTGPMNAGKTTYAIDRLIDLLEMAREGGIACSTIYIIGRRNTKFRPSTVLLNPPKGKYLLHASIRLVSSKLLSDI
jgi:hypothetical protein